MKIIYLHQYFNTPEMSGGTRSYEMARRLVAAGHEVHMVTSWRGKDGRSDWFVTEEAGIHVHWLPVPYSNRMSYSTRMKAFVSFAVRSAGRAARLGGDIVLATSTPLTIALPGVYAARRNRIPMVFEVRDLWPELPIAIGALKNPIAKWLAHRLEKFAYRNSDHVIALSPGMRDGVVAAGYDERKVTVIPNSSDLELFSENVAQASEFRSSFVKSGDTSLVVYAGTFGAINGVGYLVEIAAAALAQKADIHFLAIGEGAEYEEVRARAEALNVLGLNFELMPSVSKREMPKVFSAADVVCSLFVNLKPMWSNSANKFFDGLASGTPIAINYEGWQAELLRSSGAGVVLPPENPELAAKLLQQFCADENRLKAASAASRELAEKEFSRDVLAARLERVLKGVLAAR